MTLKSLRLGASAAITFLAFALPCFVASAQVTDAPESSGLPRNILPDGNGKPEPAREAPAPPAGRANGGPVQVGELGALEGPIAGVLDNSNGGLGQAEWQGSDRAKIVTLLQ